MLRPPHLFGSRARTLSAALWLASAATLAFSLTLPTVTFRKLASAAETYSIYGGIRVLWTDGTQVLSTVVFLFSIVFPIAKLLALLAVFFGVGDSARRRAVLRWLELLGKWSLLDVFIVAVFVGSIRLGVLANASSRGGILVFGVSIVLSMLCARVMAHAEKGGAALPLRADPPLRSWPEALLSTAALALVAAAFWLPVFEVKKLLFKSELELSRTTWKMASSGELPLALAIALLVLATTAARALIVLRLRWFRGGSARAIRCVLWLEEWAMIDVLALALVIVHTKLDQLATTTRLAGFFCVLAAAALMELDGWLFRRAVLERERARRV
jgi:paraquat-inducible protein A